MNIISKKNREVFHGADLPTEINDNFPIKASEEKVTLLKMLMIIKKDKEIQSTELINADLFLLLTSVQSMREVIAQLQKTIDPQTLAKRAIIDPSGSNSLIVNLFDNQRKLRVEVISGIYTDLYNDREVGNVSIAVTDAQDMQQMGVVSFPVIKTVMLKLPQFSKDRIMAFTIKDLLDLVYAALDEEMSLQARGKYLHLAARKYLKERFFNVMKTIAWGKDPLVLSLNDYLGYITKKVGLKSDKAVNEAMVAPGGIDLNPNGMVMSVKSDLESVNINIDSKFLGLIKQQGVKGLVPIVIKITPVENINAYLN